MEFDYCGVIIGRDLVYRNGQVMTNERARAKTDQSLRGNKDSILADKIIRNTYKTLLSRGQKGCFIYCEDSALREYFNDKLKQTKHKDIEIS